MLDIHAWTESFGDVTVSALLKVGFGDEFCGSYCGVWEYSLYLLSLLPMFITLLLSCVQHSSQLASPVAMFLDLNGHLLYRLHDG